MSDWMKRRDKLVFEAANKLTECWRNRNSYQRMSLSEYSAGAYDGYILGFNAGRADALAEAQVLVDVCKKFEYEFHEFREALEQWAKIRGDDD